MPNNRCRPHDAKSTRLSRRQRIRGSAQKLGIFILTTPDNSETKQDTRFKPGQSGNPAGKPKGTRNKATIAVEQLLEGDAEALTRKVIEKAKEGDLMALRLCLDRIAPVKKDTPVVFDLPVLGTASDAAMAASAILEAVAGGDLTPGEGTAVAGLVETFRRTLETEEIESRIKALEAKGR